MTFAGVTEPPQKWARDLFGSCYVGLRAKPDRSGLVQPWTIGTKSSVHDTATADSAYSRWSALGEEIGSAMAPGPGHDSTNDEVDRERGGWTIPLGRETVGVRVD